MFDSLIRKFSTKSQHRSTTCFPQPLGQCHSFGASSKISIDLNSNPLFLLNSRRNQSSDVATIELQDLTNRGDRVKQLGCYPRPTTTSNPNDEHIYEEILDETTRQQHRNSNSRFNNTSSSQESMVVNEIASSSTHRNGSTKKSVRFNPSNLFQQQQQQSQIIFDSPSSITSFRPSAQKQHTSIHSQTNSNSNSILKKKNRSNCDSLDSAISTSSSSCASHSPQQLTPSLVFPGMVIREPVANESTASLSSSSSFGIYTNTSLNSSGSVVSTASSHHSSHAFSQLVEEFMSKVATAKPVESAVETNTHTARVNSENCRGRVAMPDDRLSFRVTNLTLEDLKQRQKLIYMHSIGSNNPQQQHRVVQKMPINV